MENELEQVVHKKLRGMAVRILSCLENTLSCHLDGLQDRDQFNLGGNDLRILRSEILNAAGDTTRALVSLINDAPKGGKVSFSREMIAAFNASTVRFIPQGKDEEVPHFQIKGDFGLMAKIRELIGVGVVYNDTYTCVGLDAIVDTLVPFLDKLQMTGIKIAGGAYKSWREEVCEMYLGGLGNE